MGIVRDLYYARKMSAGLKLPAPTVALLIKRLRLAAAMGGGGVTKTVSGTMVHITDALAKAALSVLVNITPIQPGSGDPAPDNVRPISGLTGLSVYQSSKNLFDYNLVDSVYSTATNVRMGYYWTIPGTYTVSASGSGIVCRKKSADGTYGTAKYLPATFTETITDGEAIIIFNPTNGASKDTTVALMESTKVMLEVGSYASTYGPFNGPTYAVDWTTPAGTVYHGTVDVVSGELTVDMVNIPSYNGETINEPWLSSMDAYAAGTTPTIGAQVVYTLATPLTYQLTPQDVQMLLGENYVWSSSGDTVSVTYYAEGNANPLQSLNILLGGRYSNPKTADDVSDKEALEIILGGNK